MKVNQKKFETLSKNQETIFSVLRRKNQINPIYQVERYHNLPLSKIRDKIVMFNRKASGNLLEYETVERFNQNIELGYFKYWVLNQ